MQATCTYPSCPATPVTSPPATTSTTQPAGTASTLPFTGSDVFGVGAIGLMAVIVGTVFVHRSRAAARRAAALVRSE